MKFAFDFPFCLVENTRRQTRNRGVDAILDNIKMMIIAKESVC